MFQEPKSHLQSNDKRMISPKSSEQAAPTNWRKTRKYKIYRFAIDLFEPAGRYRPSNFEIGHSGLQFGKVVGAPRVLINWPALITATASFLYLVVLGFFLSRCLLQPTGSSDKWKEEEERGNEGGNVSGPFRPSFFHPLNLEISISSPGILTRSIFWRARAAEKVPGHKEGTKGCRYMYAHVASGSGPAIWQLIWPIKKPASP